jgi:hypothetical protein
VSSAAAGAAAFAEAAVRAAGAGAAAGGGAGAGAGAGGGSPFLREPAHFRLGAQSRTAASAAARGVVPADNARMRVVRAALRERLPREPRAAALALRHKLGLRDGDGDGVLREEELLGALIDLAPSSLTASDVGHVARLLRGAEHAAGAAAAAAATGAAGAADDDSVPVLAANDEGGSLLSSRSRSAAGGEGGGGGGGAVGRGGGVGVDAVAAWLLGLEGGTEAAAWQNRSPIVADAHRAAVGEAGVADKVGAPAASRLDYASAATAYVVFRAGWEQRHGAAARKEAALDEAIGSEGPTWASASPRPFRVLHVGAGAPPPPPLPPPPPPPPTDAA